MKKNKAKKVFSLVLGAAMALSAFPASAAEVKDDGDTVFYVDFDSPLPEGSVNNYVYYYDDGIEGNDALFGGEGNGKKGTAYIKLPDNVTAGVTDFTLAAWAKFNVGTSWQRIVDLGNGQNNYVFIGLATDGIIRGQIRNGGGEEIKLSAPEKINLCEWTHIALTQRGTTLTLYVNGEAADSREISYTLDAMGETKQNYLGRSQFDDPYFCGYMDNVLLAKRAYSDEEMKNLANREAEVTEELLASYVDIPNAASVKDNLTLPEEVNGAKIEWTSSNESVVSTKAVQNGDYVIPAGVVTRGEKDETVELTAKITKGDIAAEKKFEVTVKARPEALGEMGGYLYAYFRGYVDGSDEHLQIHVAASEDGYNWFDLNGNYPILTSTMGTTGLRDPYIIRSKDGDRFYLIATDLNTLDAQGWGPWSLAGSKYLAVWESEDLINWSEERLVKFADDDIGCAWAPEAIWDEDTQEYIVYAAGKDLALYREKGQQVDTVYVARTRDFRTFSEPEYFTAPVDGNGNRVAAIDSTIIHADDGKYYQFYKKYSGQVVMMVSDHASGPYEEVSAFSPIGGEGPAIYKVNGSEQYCLCIDNYSVYVPYLTDNIASGKFTKATADVTMPTGSKHGVMLPVTKEEYARILDAWGALEPDEYGAEPILTYDFEAEGDYSLFGGAKVSFSEERDSNVLVLDGSEGTYLEFPENLFDRRDTFTLSLDVKENNETEMAHMTFAVGKDENHYCFFKTNPDSVRGSITIAGYGYEKKANSENLGSIGGEWHHIDFVTEPRRLAIYINGVKVAENTGIDRTISSLGLEGLKAYLGKSFYESDPYFNGEFDNVALYNRALTDTEIAQNYVTDDSEAVKLDAGMISIGYEPDAVRGNVTLSQSGLYGSTITWQTSDASVIALDGTVNIPEKGEGDIRVLLTATVAKGEAKQVREIYVTVKENTETWTSTADYSTKDFDKATGEAVFSYDITADELTDGFVGICSSSNAPSDWSGYNMAVRIQPDGTFDAYNGAAFNYQKTNTVTYEAGKTYRVIIKANVQSKTYSVYVIKDKEIYTVAENFTFRQSAPAASDLAKVTVRGGYGKAAGLFEVSDFKVQNGDVYIENAYFENGKISCDILSLTEKEGIMCMALYGENGAFLGAKAVKVEMGVGYTPFEYEADADRATLMLWNSLSGMAPYAQCRSRKNVK